MCHHGDPRVPLKRILVKSRTVTSSNLYIFCSMDVHLHVGAVLPWDTLPPNLRKRSARQSFPGVYFRSLKQKKSRVYAATFLRDTGLQQTKKGGHLSTQPLH